jgi:hypothetical protein
MPVSMLPVATENSWPSWLGKITATAEKRKRKPQARTRKTPAVDIKTCATSKNVSLLAGVSLRQLQWWDEQLVLVPAYIHNHKRLYSPEQVQVAVKIGVMRKAGVTFHQCRRVLKLGLVFDAVAVIDGPRVVDGTLVVPRSKQ